MIFKKLDDYLMYQSIIFLRALIEYEYRKSIKMGRLIANREISALKRVKEIIDRGKE